MVIFKEAVDSPEQPITIDYELRPFYSTVTERTTLGWEPIFHFASSFKPIEGAIYAIHGDLAISGDRAGISMSHIERFEEFVHVVEDHEGGLVERTEWLPVIKNDFTIAFESDISAKDHHGEKAPREIQIRWARVLAFELIKRGFVIGSFTFDGFQSTDTIQIFTRLGIESDRVSTDRDPDLWKTLKDVASDGRLKIPYSRILLEELESLSRFNGKVDHPPGGSKDLADALAGSVSGAILLGGQEDEEGAIVDVGAQMFYSGASGANLAGTEELSLTLGSPMGLPIGMDGMNLHG
jgi:hypothetical protein